MKTAKEMFEELGYELVFDTKDEKRVRMNNRWIEFSKVDFEAYIDVYYYKDEKKLGTFITIDDLQAINQMCKELGWLE